MEPSIPVIDHKGAMERLDGDEELWGEIRSIWVEDVPNMLDAVREAFASGDPDKLRRAAHALKGASSNVGATRVAESARMLETNALAGERTVLGAEVDRLSEEVARALEVLATPLT